MINLILKDLILARRTLGIFALMLLAVLCLYGWRGMEPGPYVVFGCLMAAMAPLSALATEDKFKALALGCSLPVRRDDIVLGKYMSAWLTGLVGYVALTAVGLLMPWTHINAEGLLKPDLLFRALLTIAIVIGLLLPFTLRFGFMGLLLFGVVAQVLGVLVFALAVLDPGRFNPEIIIGTIRHGAESLRQSLGAAGYRLVLLSAAGLLNFLSLIISRALFRRREF